MPGTTYGYSVPRPAILRSEGSVRARHAACLATVCGALLLVLCASCRGPATTFQRDSANDYTLGWFHRVERGETLASIAAYYERTVGVLAQLNDLSPPYPLRENMHLYIPPDNSDAVLANPVMTMDRIRLARIYQDRQAGLPEDPAADEVPRKYAAPVKVAAEGQALASGGGDPADLLARTGRSAKTKAPTTADVAAARNAPRSSASSKASRTAVAAAARRPPLTVAPPRAASGRSLLMPLRTPFRVARPFVATGLTTTHLGVDMAANNGTLIYAASGGKVLRSGEYLSYGNMVLIDHGGGFSSLYGHNSVNLVREGDTVKAAQPIARVGATGRAAGPHVHFELRYNGVAVDPTAYLPPLPEDLRAVAGRKDDKK